MARELSLSQQQFEPIHAKDEFKWENDAVHTILREMFPRQYGLPNVFNSQGGGSQNEVGNLPG